MQHYIIDGNNLIGKIKELIILQKKNKQATREKIAFLIEKYFAGKKQKVTLHFDGHPNIPIKIFHAKIVYSENKTADEKIKDQISNINNRKSLIVVTSDLNIKEFAKVCGCKVISSEEFGIKLKSRKSIDEEKSRIKEIDDIEMFKRLFNSK